MFWVVKLFLWTFMALLQNGRPLPCGSKVCEKARLHPPNIAGGFLHMILMILIPIMQFLMFSVS